MPVVPGGCVSQAARFSLSMGKRALAALLSQGGEDKGEGIAHKVLRSAVKAHGSLPGGMSNWSLFPQTFCLRQCQAWAPLAPLPLRFSCSRLAQAILVLMFCVASFICSEALHGEAEHNRSP